MAKNLRDQATAFWMVQNLVASVEPEQEQQQRRVQPTRATYQRLGKHNPTKKQKSDRGNRRATNTKVTGQHLVNQRLNAQ